MSVELRGITLHRPWPWAILRCGKRIENRSWIPRWAAGEPRADGFVPARGLRLAIHAGLKLDRAALEFVLRLCPEVGAPSEEDLVAGAIVGTCRVVGFAPAGCRPWCSSPWFFGPWGWVLSEVRELERPVFVRGRQGLWRVDDGVRSELGLEGE